jgi:DNA-binding NtrC family response regulator
VARALERRQLSHENAQLRARLERSELVRPLDTNYAPLRAVLEVAHRAAAGSASILLTGPAGVGKYALAQELHRASARGRGPFVALSAAQLRGADAARLLFGRAARDGAVVESAALSTTGTLYLGDLGALSAVLQTRLLRALSVGEFRAEAGATLWPVRARIIAATRESPDDPASKVQPELVARLGGVRLTIPALAERPDDIERLATTFVHASSGGSVTLAPDAVAMLRAHRWPGNAAELRTVLTGVLAQCRSDTITAGDLTVEASSTTPLVEVERRHIAAVLGAADWHQGRAAEILGISPKTLYRKIREYGLHRPRSGARA